MKTNPLRTSVVAALATVLTCSALPGCSGKKTQPEPQDQQAGQIEKKSDSTSPSMSSGANMKSSGQTCDQQAGQAALEDKSSDRVAARPANECNCSCGLPTNLHTEG